MYRVPPERGGGTGTPDTPLTPPCPANPSDKTLPKDER